MVNWLSNFKCLAFTVQTSSSAIAERSRDACSISNRKPVNFRLKGYVSHWSMDR